MDIDSVIDKDLEKRAKIAKLEQRKSVKCSCGCVVRYANFNKLGWGICPRCGSKVVKRRDAFKDKMKSMLKGD